MKTISLIGLCSTLAACAAQTPNLDAQFGDSVRIARAQQILNPEASANTTPVAGLDGKAAKAAMGRYEDSFKTPPPTINVINIGGSIAGGSK